MIALLQMSNLHKLFLPPFIINLEHYDGQLTVAKCKRTCHLDLIWKLDQVTSKEATYVLVFWSLKFNPEFGTYNFIYRIAFSINKNFQSCFTLTFNRVRLERIRYLVNLAAGESNGEDAARRRLLNVSHRVFGTKIKYL